MVGMNAIEVKVMPESVETDFEKIKSGIKEKLDKAKNIQIDEREIAFGLKSLHLLIAWPEDQDTDEIENKINQIEGVSSATIENIRRAFG